MTCLKAVRAVAELLLIAAVVYFGVQWPRSAGGWYSHIVKRYPTRQMVVALTYDDGPHPEFTPQILDVLDRYGVKATFFMVGESVESYPEVAREVVRRGHSMGNHTYTHPRDIESYSQPQMAAEMSKCEASVERIGGKSAGIYRPPGGFIDRAAYATASKEGYRTILWTVSADHRDAPTPELMARRVIEQAKPGAIILLHDGGSVTRWKDVAATPLIIEALRRRGYHFATVPELLRMR